MHNRVGDEEKSTCSKRTEFLTPPPLSSSSSSSLGPLLAPHTKYLLENAVLLLAAIAAHRCFAQHPALSASVIPLIKVLKAYGAKKTMARHGNQALWCLGLEPALRVLIVRNAGLEVIEATADAVAQTLGVA